MLGSDLPCLDLLEVTPAILRGLMREISDDDARWKPAPDRFSIAEVLAHLSHSEDHCYRMRVDRFLKEESPFFEADEARMYLDLYRDADPDDSFDHFEEQPENNIEFLENLPTAPRTSNAPPNETPPPGKEASLLNQLSPERRALLALNGVAVLVLGIVPDPLLRACLQAIQHTLLL